MSVGHGENISVAVRIRNGIRIDRAFRRLFNGRNTVPVLTVFTGSAVYAVFTGCAVYAVFSVFTGGTVYTIFTVLSVTSVRTIRYGKGRCFSVRKGHGVCIRFSVTRSLFDRLDTVPVLSVLTGSAVFSVFTGGTVRAVLSVLSVTPVRTVHYGKGRCFSVCKCDCVGVHRAFRRGFSDGFYPIAIGTIRPVAASHERKHEHDSQSECYDKRESFFHNIPPYI